MTYPPVPFLARASCHRRDDARTYILLRTMRAATLSSQSVPRALPAMVFSQQQPRLLFVLPSRACDALVFALRHSPELTVLLCAGWCVERRRVERGLRDDNAPLYTAFMPFASLATRSYRRTRAAVDHERCRGTNDLIYSSIRVAQQPAPLAYLRLLCLRRNHVIVLCLLPSLSPRNDVATAFCVNAVTTRRCLSSRTLTRATSTATMSPPLSFRRYAATTPYKPITPA